PAQALGELADVARIADHGAVDLARLARVRPRLPRARYARQLLEHRLPGVPGGAGNEGDRHGGELTTTRARRCTTCGAPWRRGTSRRATRRCRWRRCRWRCRCAARPESVAAAAPGGSPAAPGGPPAAWAPRG